MPSKKSKALVKIEPTYTERTVQVQKKAEVAMIKQIQGLWKSLKSDEKILSQKAIAVVNTASHIGGVLLQIVGGEQLGLSFWNSHCSKQLPFNFDAAKELIAVHKKVPEPITDFKQIFPVWNQVNLAMGTLELPERTEQQTASSSTPLLAITHAFRQGFVCFEKWTATEPIDDWDKSRLETVHAETKQIHDLHERAAALLKKKG